MAKAVNFQNGVASFGNVITGGISDVGNIYWVNNSPTSTKGAEMFRKYGKVKYGDSSDMLHTTMASAIAACKGGRNDYVIVGTGAYTLTTAATLAGKSSVHLIAQNGLGRESGCVGATVLTQTGNYEAVILESYAELAGFSIINLSGYSGVTAAITIYATNVHHNTFKMTTACGTAGAMLHQLLNSYGIVSRNRFFTYSAGTFYAAIYNGEGTGVDVLNNIITSHAASIITNGIYCDGHSAMVADNYLSESGGDGVATYGGTITNAIRIPADGCAINNRCAVGSGQGLYGGTDEHSLVDNRDGVSGGGSAIET